MKRLLLVTVLALLAGCQEPTAPPAADLATTRAPVASVSFVTSDTTIRFASWYEVRVLDAQGNPRLGGLVTFTASAPTIVTFGRRKSQGRWVILRPLKNGVGTITAHLEGHTGTITVTVVNRP